jgi:hypothetical protein
LAGSPEGHFLAAAAGPGRGEAVAHLWRSADGVTWEAVADPTDGRPLFLAADDAGTVVGVGGLRIWVTSDLETWESTWASPDPGDGDASLSLVDWDGALFVTTGLLEDGSAPILVSADGITWVESPGPDGIPGADRETYLAGTATLDGVTVALGDADGRTLAWMAGHVPTGELDGSPAG